MVCNALLLYLKGFQLLYKPKRRVSKFTFLNRAQTDYSPEKQRLAIRIGIIRKFDKGDSVLACRILVVADYSHCSCSYCSFWRRNRRLIPPVCIQWNVSLLGGPQTVSLNFLPTSSIPAKFSHLLAGKSSCRRRLQIEQPYMYQQRLDQGFYEL